MMQNTKAFLLSYIKYGDTSLILRCYTEEYGFKSFILKNYFSKKYRKKYFLFILNEIEIIFYPKKNDSLELVKEINPSYFFKEIHTDLIKSSTLTFIGEILNQILSNEHVKDLSLYQFIKTHLIALDNRKNNFSDFHLYFLINLSKYLGFYPLNTNSKLPYFNLDDGIFSLKGKSINQENNSHLWNILLEYDFNDEKNCFNSTQRSQMLEEILTYYKMHLTNFKKPTSLDILKLIFE